MVAFAQTNGEYTDPPKFGFDKAALFAYEGNAVDFRSRFEPLSRAIEASYRGLEPFRNLNRNLVEQYAGPAYGAANDKRKKYLNKFNQAIDAYMMLLAANRPHVEITTNFRQYQPFAKHYQTALNNMIAEIGLEYTIRQWVLDAFFCVGIVKIHRKDSGVVEMEPDLWMDPGTPFASNVSLDNFVYDSGARKWSEVKWAGDMYRLPKKDVEEGVKSGLYDPTVADDVQPSSKFWQSSERLEFFSQGTEVDRDEFEPMVDLIDVWVKRDKKIYTFIVKDRIKLTIDPRPLAVMDWNDKEFGPYHLLGFADVPENVMPVSPASHFDELERLMNSVFRKQARQAMRQKEFTTFTPAGQDAAKRIQRSADGDMIPVRDSRDVGTVATGGVHASNQAFFHDIAAIYNELVGNLTAMLGLGAQAETATQEQLIHTAGNRKIGQMQYRVLDAVRGMIRSLGLQLWDDQFKTIVSQMPVDGADDYYVTSTWEPGDREGNFSDYILGINVYSMVYRPPAAQAQSLLELLTTIYIPMMEQIAAQGGTVNLAMVNEKLAELLNLPWLRDIVLFQSPPMTTEEEPSVSSRGGTKSPVTTRNYTRRNIPTAGTPQSQAQVRASEWTSMAGQANGQQRNSLAQAG